MCQRKLLLPHFDGEAIGRYTEAIAAAAEREIESWPPNRTFPLARTCGATTKRMVEFTTRSVGQLVESMNAQCRADRCRQAAAESAGAPGRAADRRRRRADDLSERRDILSMLLQSRTNEGEALVRNPAALEGLLDAVRTDTNGAPWLSRRSSRRCAHGRSSRSPAGGSRCPGSSVPTRFQPTPVS
jgi:cytochrome P450